MTNNPPGATSFEMESQYMILLIGPSECNPMASKLPLSHMRNPNKSENQALKKLLLHLDLLCQNYSQKRLCNWPLKELQWHQRDAARRQGICSRCRSSRLGSGVVGGQSVQVWRRWAVARESGTTPLLLPSLPARSSPGAAASSLRRAAAATEAVRRISGVDRLHPSSSSLFSQVYYDKKS
nr:hypothetical protein Iba_chr14eCG10960 [Ipomoea batatas]